MNKKVKLLDCTLRDGGFVNDWNFGHSTINSIYNRLNTAGVDIIELGFLDERREFDENRTILPSTKDLRAVFDWHEDNHALRVAMIDYGTCSIENVENCKDSILDGIRVIFKKKDIDGALEFCKQIKDKGYKLFVQPVSITTYTDKEMLDLIEKVNELQPYTFSIVDTYGLMHREKLFKYFYLIDNNLDKDTFIGYHSHNNFQLAYSNSIELLSIETQRTIVLDGTCYGMGKGAGNANIELLALFLNENCEKEYELNYILEAIDTNIMPLYQKYAWGYSLNYFLAAANDCHPTYVNYLVKKKTLSVKSTNEILANIDEANKLTYDENLIKNSYRTYQKEVFDDAVAIERFKQELENRDILLLAPGKNLYEQQTIVESYIREHKPIVISVNVLAKKFTSDMIFVSNPKRYMQLVDKIDQLKNQKIILTSNIVESNIKADFMINYRSLLDEKVDGSETSILMLIKLLEKIGIDKVAIAGLDGFSKFGELNYANKEMMFDADLKHFEEINHVISNGLHDSSVSMNFITDSLYQEKGE